MLIWYKLALKLKRYTESQRYNKVRGLQSRAVSTATLTSLNSFPFTFVPGACRGILLLQLQTCRSACQCWAVHCRLPAWTWPVACPGT